MAHPRRRLPSPIRFVVPLAVVALGGGAEARGRGAPARPRTDVLRLPVAADRTVRPVAARGAGPATVTFYLDRHGGRIAGGVDDAAARRSWIAAEAPGGAVDVPAWGGSAAGWAQMVGCVRAGFGRLAIEVVDEEPARGDYTRIMVGGQPELVGYPSWVAGVAPSGNGVLRGAVGFVFAAALDHDPTETCESVLHEAAHTLGLDHTMGCADLMSYEQCGPKTFLDEELPCGEGEARTCQSGAQTQSSYRMLVDAVGLVGGPAPVAPPVADDDDGADDAVDEDVVDDDVVADDAAVADDADHDADDARGDGASGVTVGDAVDGDDDGDDDATFDGGDWRWDDGTDDAAAGDAPVDDADLEGDDDADDASAGCGDDAADPPGDEAADPDVVDGDGAGAAGFDPPQSGAPAGSVLRFVDLPARARGERTLSVDVLARSPAVVDDVLLVWQHGDEQRAWSCGQPEPDDDVTCARDGDHFRFRIAVGVGVRQLAALARDGAGAVWATEPRTLELVR